jgi:histidinol-phosphate aminotransferase
MVVEGSHERLAFNTIVDSLPASTPFIAPEAIERQRGRPFVARIGANESLFGPSPRAIEAMRAALTQIALYGDPENADLREAIAVREGVQPERVIIGSGIDDLLGVLVRILMNPGDAAVSSHGCYPTVAYHMNGYGARLETIPYRDYRNDLAGLAETAQRVNASLVYLANPDNPTGSYHAGADITAMLAQLNPRCALLLDEAYIEFAPAVARQALPHDDPRLIRLRTFSKAYGMAGARIGYAITPPEVTQMYNKVRLHFGVNRVAQAGALAALADQRYMTSVARKVAAGRVEYAALATEVGLAALDSATNFVAFETGSTERARLIVRELADRDIFVRSPGVGLTSLVRVTIGDTGSRQVFATAFREVCATMAPHS